MKKDISELNYKELNESIVQLDTRVEELNRQLAELSTRKEELTAEIQNRKQHVIADYIELVKKLMEASRSMVEMGIDPTSITMDDVATCTETLPVHDTKIENKDIDSFNSIDGVSEHNVEAVESCSAIDIAELDNSSECEEDDMEADSIVAMKPKGKLLTPFYQVWGLRKGEFTKTCDGPQWKHNSHRLHTPFEALCKGPMTKCMNIGNLQYRESCFIPTESRIFSADGIAPTLTRAHNDVWVMIGNDPHSLTAA